MAKPALRRRVMRSPGTKTWASGKTISATEAMDTPAKPEVDILLAQASSMKGIPVEKAPTATSAPQVRGATGSVNSFSPSTRQTTSIVTIPKRMRPEANQKGGHSSKASSVTMNVPPQVNPSVATISQLFQVIWGASVMQGAAVRRGLIAFGHAIVAHDTGHAQAVIGKMDIPARALGVAVFGQFAPVLQRLFAFPIGEREQLSRSIRLSNLSTEIKPGISDR